MKVYLATDHAGYEYKEFVKSLLLARGDVDEVVDMGALEYNEADDYPDFIMSAAEAVAKDESSRGIIFGGSGQGEAMVANRISGVRATAYYGAQQEIVRLGRAHNNANILSIGARFVPKENIEDVIGVFLTTDFSADERHVRRISKF